MCLKSEKQGGREREEVSNNIQKQIRLLRVTPNQTAKPNISPERTGNELL